MARGRPRKNPSQTAKDYPRRTREHIIADLSILHFQWIAANCGHIAEEPAHDYGYDLALYTFTENGEAENASVLFQFKATDDINKYLIDGGTTISYPIERQHIKMWEGEPFPVILVVYDAVSEKAYWLCVQQYFNSGNFTLSHKQSKISLHVPINNIVNAQAIELFREFKKAVLKRY